jgi:hypothetical protein
MQEADDGFVWWIVFHVNNKKNPGGGEIFRTRPDRPWGPPNLLYNEYRVHPGVKRPECGANHTTFF